MSEALLIELYRQIREDQAVMARLASCPNAANFVSTVIEEGVRRGLNVDPASVMSALSDLQSFINLAGGPVMTDLEHEVALAGADIGNFGTGTLPH